MIVANRLMANGARATGLGARMKRCKWRLQATNIHLTWMAKTQKSFSEFGWCRSGLAIVLNQASRTHMRSGAGMFCGNSGGWRKVIVSVSRVVFIQWDSPIFVTTVGSAGIADANAEP